MRTVLLACGVLAVAVTAPAADLPPPLELTAEQDHKMMMEQLGITSIRQGANGRDPDAPNAANYDESKGNPYPDLPDAGHSWGNGDIPDLLAKGDAPQDGRRRFGGV